MDTPTREELDRYRRREMDDNTFYYGVWRNVIIAFLLFLGGCFYSCEQHDKRETDLRKTMPLVETCVTHYPIDSVRGGRGQ